jgi:hypothetical protein
MALSSKSFRVSSQNRKIQDVPNVPIVGTPVVSVREDRSIDVPFTNPTPVTGGIPAQYRAVSTPGNFQGVSLASPITVQGLTGGTSYTFQVRAETSTGANDGFTAASSAIIPEFGAMEAIAQVVGVGNSSNMNFFNIPQNYRDLVLVVNATSNSAHSGNIIFNFSSTGTYSSTFLRGNGSSALSSRVSNSGAGPLLGGINYSSTIPTSSVVNISNYSSTSTFKSYLVRNAADLNGSGDAQLVSGLWQKTEAIYEILLSTGSASIFWTGTATLYGVRASI